MDEDALNMRNWGYYEPSFKGHLSLQLMSSMMDHDTKGFLPGRSPPPAVMVSANGSYHPREGMMSEPQAPVHVPIDYARSNWINQRDKYMGVLPANPSYPILPESSSAHPLPMSQPPNSSREEKVGSVELEDQVVEKEGRQSKKRQSGSGMKTSKSRKVKDNSNASAPRSKPAKKSMDVVINGIDMDISGIPIPVCSCTGVPQQCYRWGCGGWQSSCCTTNVSMHPLPMSTKRRGARIAGRKMSQGAFKKVLEKLAAEGYNFVNPIDLKTYWARHGTNKFVTIR